MWITGNSTLNETMSRLIHATEINTTQLEAEISEEVLIYYLNKF